MVFYKYFINEDIEQFNSIYDPLFIKKMDYICLCNLFNGRGLIKSKLCLYETYLKNRYIGENDIEIAIKRIKYKIEFVPICPVCNKNELTFVGKPNRLYTSYCSCYCAAHSKAVNANKKKTYLEKWGTENCYDSSKYKQYLKDKYGFEYWTQSENIKNKRKETLINKYGTLNMYEIPSVREKIENTCLLKYGCKHPHQSEEIQMRVNATKKKNYSKQSKPEKLLGEFLDTLYPNDVISQYSSNEYPYCCDFYIKSLDLYIEYHGSHFHHGHEFNPNDINDIQLLNKLQERANKKKHPNQYDIMIYTWTDLDVRKKKCMEDNKLNYLIYYKLPTIEQLKTDIDNKINQSNEPNNAIHI